jgi:predicted ArsR family transcriptional regulator
MDDARTAQVEAVAALAEAEQSGERPGAVLERRAFRRGAELAATVRDGGRGAALRVLEEHGFEPREDGGGIALANCPFHALAREHTELVCGMNLRLLEGVVDGVGTTDLEPRLEPSPGRCCVRLAPTTTG